MQLEAELCVHRCRWRCGGSNDGHRILPTDAKCRKEIDATRLLTPHRSATHQSVATVRRPFPTSLHFDNARCVSEAQKLDIYRQCFPDASASRTLARLCRRQVVPIHPVAVLIGVASSCYHKSGAI
uniref:Uncharacterized protein n=1 Tax=Physcomitrium patens TaxID=3218 RepID=A0A2K1K7U6_PHYPA|nr:hypothetical protein PHYPA_011745 [Physcomitrium patens]